MLKGFWKGAKDDQLDAYAFVLSGLARLASKCESLDEGVKQLLEKASESKPDDRQGLLSAFNDYLKRPAQSDAQLDRIARQFHLHLIETLAVRLTMAAEHDLVIGHLLASLQQPLTQSRPSIGLVAQAYCPENVSNAVQVLGQGNAVRSGLLQIIGEDNPLPERVLRIALPIVLALQGLESTWPGTEPVVFGPSKVRLGATTELAAAAFANRLQPESEMAPALVIRSGDRSEACAAAALVALGAGARALHVTADHLSGIAPWLVLNHAIPVFSQWLGPGERKALPPIACYGGPVIVLTGPEGEFECDNRLVLDWHLGIPPAAERAQLWAGAIGDSDLAQQLARDHRHTAGRIAALAARAHEECASKSDAISSGDPARPVPISASMIRNISRRGDTVGLSALAEWIPDEVGDDALIVDATLRSELNSLVARCRLREQFPCQLGPSVQARYRPSVRALFVGPSGTGKTLAVSWLASRLSMPLFRVDLSAVTSKYIGETEKNLSQLLARAERNEVMLLFDEADSLFGKRTDIHEANDRFANAQTNYLLQRMDSYDGIAILTSNGRSRFDDAFSRRFDAVLNFAAPGPEGRRALWVAHLGASHKVAAAQLNLLSAVAELTGGQIRNAVLRAAVDAAQDGVGIQFAHLLTGVASEYRKISRQLPTELKQAHMAAQPAQMIPASMN